MSAWIGRGDALLPVSALSRGWKVAVVFGASLFVAVAAQIHVPMMPVPMTMHTFAILLVGVLIGPRLGFAALMVYLAQGFMGLPVFAGGAAGPAVFLGATAGYLIGFPFGALACGLVANRGGNRALLTLAGCAAGLVAIYLPGLAWLAFGLGLGLEKAVAVGMLPFLLGEALKGAAVVAIAVSADRLVRRL